MGWNGEYSEPNGNGAMRLPDTGLKLQELARSSRSGLDQCGRQLGSDLQRLCLERKFVNYFSLSVRDLHSPVRPGLIRPYISRIISQENIVASCQTSSRVPESYNFRFVSLVANRESLKTVVGFWWQMGIVHEAAYGSGAA
jgi:hypothetical protein